MCHFLPRGIVNAILDHLEQAKPFQQVVGLAGSLVAGEALSVYGVTGSLAALIVAGLYRQQKRPILVICRDQERAEETRDDLGLLLASGELSYFSGGDPADAAALRTLVSGATAVVVTHPRALLVPLPLPQGVEELLLSVATGDAVGYEHLKGKLARFGFTRTDFVGEPGDCSVRGGIIDVYPFVGDHPLRLEFSGDTLESIREFDPLSQRSIRELSSAVIVPNLLVPADKGGDGSPGSRLVDYLVPGALIALDEPDLLRAEYEAGARRKAQENPSFDQLESLLGLFSRLLLRAGGAKAQQPDFRALSQPSFNGSIRAFRAALQDLDRQGLRVVLSCDGAAEVGRLRELLLTIDPLPGLEDDGVDVAPPDFSRIEFQQHSLHRGFISSPAGLAVFTEHQIFNRLKRRGRRKPARARGLSEREVQQLHRGDYVVHADFGIGRFAGLNRIRIGSSEQEVVKVLYAEKDTLYVNLDYITRLQKYSSGEGHIPKLNRLGSPDWERLKSRTKRRVKDIARDLIGLYAKRKHSTGHGFRADTPWQKELEASFQYEDTFDQAKATRDVKQDMESLVPMDRLICGDVGFGKTEVAVRAAFKSVMDGKQVAVLVPTTILSIQHFNTFVDRTVRYGVQVRVLSRLKMKKEGQQILEDLHRGRVDILIGTHRLLSRDVRFKDLGLLIIDEEHRFGVAAKEKLRQLRTGVDTLALTATPIPRTLHFSLMGARDLSIIATAPRNRRPILTEILQWDNDVIREAIARELQRNGQVYVVHDRIQDIEEITKKVRALRPDARVAYAHGQMHAHELETVMLEFLERRVDILVSTKIIESGLDIPNVNTIIIHRADRFGMAELYQLRGRVGRSNTQAYAYLLVPPLATLPTGTIKRLQALQEFNELGSGFNLAMRDLEIRGAGNLLGAEQSGFIESMGFETYTRILEEAVQELKEEEFQDLFPAGERRVRRGQETVVEPEFDALIPESYLPSDVERLAVYRRLYAMTTETQLQEVADELCDRFGKFPAEVDNLFGVVKLRLRAARVGFKKVNISEQGMEMEFPPESDQEFYEGEIFQGIIGEVSRQKGKGVTLHHTESLLRLKADFSFFPRAATPCEAGLQILQLLTASSLSPARPSEPPTS